MNSKLHHCVETSPEAMPTYVRFDPEHNVIIIGQTVDIDEGNTVHTQIVITPDMSCEIWDILDENIVNDQVIQTIKGTDVH